MADGDIRIDTETQLRDGTRVRLFAIESSEYPGGVNYRFHHYDPESGCGILRYDNSQVPTHGAGHHHRHEWDDGDEHVTELEFDDLESHLERFRDEVTDDERK
ncbi:toxin-antitoxin system TumE family protein [Saliphagus infecundisoli]|uniref:DUF6516 family protein n=1 Tax=Saliphagus infecundisoli TaxID=1849069 RepID=A0ABD5QHM4_9EURY